MTQSQPRFVAYLRVSTDRQGRSGLGLEAQREAVSRYVAGKGGLIVSPEYLEVESGKRNDRPELGKALRQCRLTGSTLVVAKLDRLSRNAAFLMTLRDSGAEFVAADLPEANTMTVGVMALVAQHERESISARTKSALAAAKVRGKALGGSRAGAGDIRLYQAEGVLAARQRADFGARELQELFAGMEGEGLSMSAMARRLNETGILTMRGLRGAWTATAVRRVRNRIG